MTAAAERLRQEEGSTFKDVCLQLEIPYSSLLRWRRRRWAGQVLVGKPGPPKLEPLPVGDLNEAIRGLRFSPRRTRGTGELYERFRDSISRRDLHAYLREFRLELKGLQHDLERRVEWLLPGSVWSIDDTEAALLPQGQGMIHLLYDLGGRFNLSVLGAEVMAHGEQIAQNLEKAFKAFGAPLFLKRDNGSNLNHWCVNEVLSENSVIPLNSPKYYPPYNGAIEHEQALVKNELFKRVGGRALEGPEYGLQCELSGHVLNHRQRRVLGGRTPCAAMEAGRRLVRMEYNRRKREEVFKEIRGLAVDITRRLGDDRDRVTELAFRYAAETWMQQKSLIHVSFPKEVSPHYAFFKAH
jgi:hypothetical protein